MMELSLKSKCIKRKHKKKKIRFPEDALSPILKPNSVNGACNWMRLQTVMGSSPEEKLKGIETRVKRNICLKDYIPPFSQNLIKKKNSAEKLQENAKIKTKSDSGDVVNQCPNNKLTDESDQLKTTPKKNQNQPHKFNFNGSVDKSPKINSDLDVKRNRYDEKRLTKAVAMDCEMVGTGPKGDTSIIARVSIVNAYGVCLYDEFVKPKERVTDYRTKISGVRPSDLKKGKDLFEVQKDVLSIIEGRILVGHSIKYDLDVLFISHPRHLIRDTSLYKPFRELCGGRTPSLKKLTSKILGCEIQSGEHSSVEDAHATMLLYLRQREVWETEVEDAQATMLLYLRQKQEWEKQVKALRKRKPRVFENHTKN